MKIQTLILSCFLVPAGAYADAALTTGDLEKICISKNADDRSICSLIIKAFKDGFLEGVGNGAMGTYRYDPQVLGMIKDVNMNDFAPRFSKVVEQSSCIQKVQVDDLIKAFALYVKQNPSMRSEPYRTAMFRTINATYCKE